MDGADTRQRIEDLGRAHGFGAQATLCLHRALVAGGGMAQFSHPELGGLGQWAGGGMVMIGEMGNPELRRRVGDLCAALAVEPGRPAAERAVAEPEDAGRAWSVPRVAEAVPADRGADRPAPSPDHAGDPVATIARLAALRDVGALTDGEFASKKAELLARV